MLTIIIGTTVERQNVPFTGTRNPMGFIHGQIAPRYFEVTNYLLYGKEYIYSGLKNMAKGWRFYQGLNGIFRLNLPNNYLFTGISVRACNGTSPCELPARFGAYMKTKTNSWIPLACTKDEDGGSAVGGCVLLNILFTCTVILVGWKEFSGTV